MGYRLSVMALRQAQGDSGLSVVGCRFWVMALRQAQDDSGLSVVGCGLWPFDRLRVTVGYGYRLIVSIVKYSINRKARLFRKNFVNVYRK